MSSPLKFPLTEVKENGELAVRADVGPELFPDALTEGSLVGQVSVEGLIRRIDDEANFQGSAKGRWRFECTRCLTPVEAAWDTSFEATAPIDGGPMDLTDEVRQAIALAQPMKIFCRPDCRGLCPVCRKNRNQGDCGHTTEEPQESRRPRLTPRPQKG
jgi:uncharacterized metal-binding protein YceD (DUF177 family)